MTPEVRKVIRSDLCLIETDRDYGPQQPHLFCLTDAFSSDDARHHIGELVLELIGVTGIELVCLEARFGLISPMVNQAREPMKPAEAMALLKDKKLEYERFLALAVHTPLELWGIDDEPLYRRISTTMKPLIARRQHWETLLGALSLDFRGRTHEGLSEDYGEFMRRSAECENDIKGRMELLIEQAGKLAIDLKPLAALQGLLDTMRRENEIDFEEANNESQRMQVELNEILSSRSLSLRRSFAALGLEGRSPQELMARLANPGDMGSLRRTLANTTLGRLVAEGMRRQPGKSPTTAAELLELFHTTFQQIEDDTVAVFARQEVDHSSQSKLYDHLLDLMRLFGFDERQYPNVVRHAHYLHRFANTDMMRLLEEIDIVSRRIATKLCRNDLDRTHVKLREQLALLTDLLTLKMTSGDVKTIQGHDDDLQHAELCAALKHFIPDNPALGELVENPDDYTRSYETAMDYFNLMTARSNKMATNTLARMRDSGRHQAILITGGFHRAVLTSNFARQQVSHTVLMPVIREAPSAENEQAYFAALAQQ